MAREKTTANEPAAAIDPGGTRPTKAAAKGKKGSEAAPKQKVQSGDRNATKREKP